PDVDPGTHPYISTGLKKNKFGIPADQAMEAYRFAHAMDMVDVVGIDFHIGSQITRTGPFVDAVKSVMELVRALKSEGMDVKYLDIGGGLGIPYTDEEPPLPAEYAEAVGKELADAGLSVILEPGRAMVGNAGVLVTRVLYNKSGAKNFIVADAGMNDLLRPSIYQAYHAVLPVKKNTRATITADVVGPICESGDFLAKDRDMPPAQPGELLSVMSAGAYGFVMASNYNSRPRPAEVLVSGGEFAVVRERETREDLVRGESVPEFL
ncbi:MAG: diaminopimelate decarboxylase, partial [Deltaproteobacteria bacterium]|nr:diaminopimelate decarboxylase [Deltaproteobacteria bacterium]